MTAIVELRYHQATNNESLIVVITVIFLLFRINLIRQMVYQFLINTYQPQRFKNENLIRSWCLIREHIFCPTYIK